MTRVGAGGRWVAITPASSFAAPLKMKWSPIKVLLTPDGPATSVEP
jgi:hypothetical protein